MSDLLPRGDDGEDGNSYTTTPAVQCSDDPFPYTLAMSSGATLRLDEMLSPVRNFAQFDGRRSEVTIDIIPPDVRREAYRYVSTVIHENPRANGIVVLVHNQDVPRSVTDLPPIIGIERSTFALKNTFANLGVAVVRLQNPTKLFLKAVIDLISSPNDFHQSLEYPPSYKYFLFYVTGHGARRVIFTKDGSIAYYDIVSPFQRKPTKFSSWYFFFDCCRTVRLDDLSLYPDGREVNFPEVNISPETCIVYSTTSGANAWGPGDGVSFMSMAMLDHLKEPVTMDEILSRLRQALRGVQCAASHNATSKTINLRSEFDRAIQPSIDEPTIESDSDGSKAHLSVRVKPPLAINNEGSVYQSCEVQARRESDVWLTLPLVDSTSLSVLPSTVDLKVVLPASMHSESSRLEFRVVVHFTGQLHVFSNTVLVSPPCTTVKCLGQPLGKAGGFGRVYKVTMTDGRILAGKVFHEFIIDGDDFDKKLKRETSIMKKCNHDHVVKYFSTCSIPEKSTAPVLLMELMEIDFQSYYTSKQLSVHNVVEILIQVARGLEYLHSQNIIHRDLSASNVLLNRTSDSPHAKISDFGNSRFVDSMHSLVTMTRMLGTRYYLAPEVDCHHPHYNKKADQFSFGHLSLVSTIQQVITWLPDVRCPDLDNPGIYLARTEVQIRSEYFEILRQRIGQGGNTFETLIKSCLALSSNERPSSSELLGKLTEILDDTLEYEQEVNSNSNSISLPSDASSLGIN